MDKNLRKNLQEVIESFGGVCVQVNNEHFGKVKVLFSYKEFLDILIERQQGCVYNDRTICLLKPEKNYYIQ